MITLLQRVLYAKVLVNQSIVGEIQKGLLVFVGIEKTDTVAVVDHLLHRLLYYRVFSDVEGRMNLNVQEVAGGLLLVPQFTLVADTRKGMRPSFSDAAAPSISQPLFEYMVKKAQEDYPHVASGRFGASMEVSLCNDGPVTFLLHS